MTTILRKILPVVTLLALSHLAGAQFYQPITIDPAALKFFNKDSAFIANTEVITETDGKPDVMPIKIAVLGNMTRVEMDITKQQGGKTYDTVTPGYFADLKTAGSAESVSIFNPDKKFVFTILPRLKAYLQTPISEKELEEIKQRPKAEKIDLGNVILDNRACTKHTIKFKAEGPMDIWRTWESPSATVWIAKDVSACPLRVDVFGSDGRTNCTFLIKDIQTNKVDKNLFQPPKGFTKCETPEALMKIIMEHWPADKTK